MESKSNETGSQLEGGSETTAFSQPLVLEESQIDETQIFETSEQYNEIDESEPYKIVTKSSSISKITQKVDIQWDKSEDMFENDFKEHSNESTNGNDNLMEKQEENKSTPPRKRKDDSESDEMTPAKLIKISSDEISVQDLNVDKNDILVNKSKSSNESATSVSILSGKINLRPREKDIQTSKSESSSVEIIDKSQIIETVNLIDTSSSENSKKDLIESESTDQNCESIQMASTLSATSSANFSEEVTTLIVSEKISRTITSSPLLNDSVKASANNISEEPNSSPIVKDSVQTVETATSQVEEIVNKPSELVDTPTECSGQNEITNLSNNSNENLSHEIQNTSYKSDSTVEATDKTINPMKKHIFYVEVYYTINELDTKPVQKEINQVNCEDITDIVHSKRVSDISSSALGDISKSNSPNSSSSGLGPFQLPNRFSTISNASSRLSTLSRFSTSSTSSVLSSASALATKLREEHFLIPEIPLRNKDKIHSPIVSSKRLSTEQMENIKSHWLNSEQIFKILEAIDNSSHSANVSDISPVQLKKSEKTITPPENSVPTLNKIEEVSTPKSEKRSVRKKRALKSENQQQQPPAETPTRSGRKNKRANSASRDLSTPEPVTTTSLSTISMKQEVFARWTDKKYYSGVIEEHTKDNKWLVKFDDGNKKILVEDYIIVGCQNLLKGHSVYALNHKTSEYETGIVTGLLVENETLQYKIDLDNGKTITAPAEDLFLTEDQARTVKEMNSVLAQQPATPKHSSTVSLDNIVEGKRSTRANRKYTSDPFSPRPGVSGTRKMTPRKLDSEDEKSIDSKSECCVLEEIGGVEPEMKIMSTPSKANKGPGKIKGTMKRLKRPPKYKMYEDDQLGPIPAEDSNIFDGLSFILVCASVSTIGGSDIESQSSGTETENETMEFTKVPFLEERLKQQITAGGGIMYNHFEEIPPSDYDMCKLISNRPNKTAKYLQCIAAGITILNHEWIVNCCKENRRLPYQELPMGWSIEKKKFIDSFHRTSTKPFLDLLIYFAPNIDKNYLKFWERICTMSGGTVIIMENEDIDFQTAAFVLADTECPEQIVDRAAQLNIPLLSTTWIIQSIIHGEYRPFDAHPKYAYDAIEYD